MPALVQPVAPALEPERLIWAAKLDALVEACRKSGAQRAWLIGSVARGAADEWSDVDVVVEQETDLRPLDRPSAFLAALAPRFPCDVLVYRPEELASLLKGEQPFLTQAFKDARLIWNGSAVDGNWITALDAPDGDGQGSYPAQPEAVRRPFSERTDEDRSMFDAAAVAQSWLQQAQSDLESARVLRRAGQFAQACFFAQQAGEKAMKAALIRLGDRQVLGHDVGSLVARAQGREPRFGPLLGDGAFLDRFYFATRYPDAWVGAGVPATKYFDRDAGEATDAAERVLRVAEQVLKDRDGS
jgi:HEPN domain-containing protein/predicted nucleotidyltransferase